MSVTSRFNAEFRNTAFNKFKKKLTMKNLKIKTIFILFISIISVSQGYASNIPSELIAAPKNQTQLFICWPNDPACKDRNLQD